MAIKAHVEGHVFDLDTLVELFEQGDPQVVKEADGYYLKSARFDGQASDGGQLVETGTRLLRQVMGVARALDSSFRPVTLTGRFVDEDSGVHHVVVAETATARARASVAVVTQVEPATPPASPPPPKGPEYFDLIATHPAVEEVLEILGGSSVSLTWVDLYKVYEIVRHDVGNDKALKTKAWVPDGDASAFTASANRPDVSQSEARHARVSGKPPKRTMTLAQGEDFTRRLVVAWLDSLKQP